MINARGKKYFHCFTAGDYPQGSLAVTDLIEIVNNYDRAFRMAPVWVGHINLADRTLSDKEPRALAWIDDLLLVGDKLYCSFWKISNELLYIVESGQFLFWSAEFVYYLINDEKKLYFFALGLTNRPGVLNLEPLNYDELLDSDSASKLDSNQFTFKNKYIGDKLQFNYKFQDENLFFINQSNGSIMNKHLVLIASGIGIDSAQFTDEAALVSAINLKFTDITSKVTTLSDELAVLKKKPAEESDEVRQYTAKLAELNKQLAESLGQFAVDSKKITPEQKDSIVQFAMANYDSAKQYVDKMPVNPVFDGKTITDDKSKHSDVDDKKLYKKDGSRYTYAEVLKDPALQKQFTAQELEVLRGDSIFAGSK